MGKTSLASWLRLWRKASRLTQAQVTEKSGVPQHQVSRFENGEIDKPSMEELVRVASVYGIEPNELARLAGWWLPSPRYSSEDPRWVYAQNFLAHASDVDREKLLDELYDRVLFHETLRRLAEEADDPKIAVTA